MTTTLPLLLGTSNPSKIEIIRAILAEVPVQLVTPPELGIFIQVKEDGATCEENAAIKASAYHAAAGLPTFAVDAALAIEGLPPEEQPGVYVRRLRRSGEDTPEADDLEMLAHYSAAVKRLGGRGVALWTVGTAFASNGRAVLVQVYRFQAILVPQPSPVRLPGLPLSSLMLDRRTGRYFSETDHRDREDAGWIRAIVRGYLASLSAMPS